MIAKCPECNSANRLSDELAGKQVRCPRCKAKFVAAGSRPKKWYYGDDDNKIGPIKQDLFNDLVDDGTIAPDTLVWCKGMASWQPLHEVQPAATTEESHTAFAPANMLEHDAGITGAESGLKYGGLGSRLIAKIIDLIFMLALAAMVEGLSRKLFPGAFTLNTVSPDEVSLVAIVTLLINMLIGISYVTWFVGKLGATPGKMIVQLKITNPSGGKIGYGHAFGRYCGEYIAALGVMSCVTLFAFWGISNFFPLNPVLTSVSGAIIFASAIVYGPAWFDPQRRTLYDRLCNTRVLVS
jgi:predicted Zn finger-like uncharacterized protein